MPGQFTIAVGRPRSTARHDLEIVANRIREGRFQRSLSLLTAGTSIASGLEVAYEHYRGSYSRRVMYTPVIMSALLAVAGIAGFFSGRAAQNRSALGLGGNARRCRHRFLLPRARHPAKARRVAASHDQHDYGAADFCPAAVWYERVSRAHRFLPSTAKSFLQPAITTRTLARQAFAREGRKGIALGGTGYSRGTLSAAGSDRDRSQRAAQRLRSFLFALQKQFSLCRAVDSHYSCTRSRRARPLPP